MPNTRSTRFVDAVGSRDSKGMHYHIRLRAVCSLHGQKWPNDDDVVDDDVDDAAEQRLSSVFALRADGLQPSLSQLSKGIRRVPSLL